MLHPRFNRSIMYETSCNFCENVKVSLIYVCIVLVEIILIDERKHLVK